MSLLLVLVAHDGRTLQLDVAGSTRVETVQAALVTATGIALADQIVMCAGARLDPSKQLAAYKLPVADPAAAEDLPVFLYHKAFLRPGAEPPPAEPLPLQDVEVPGLATVGLRHPLAAAHSPLIRALPDYEAQFTQQLAEARAHWEASQARLHRCRQLMSEQEVQARAADAARANVESHYTYIAAMYGGFVDRYVAQHRHHAGLLAQFGALTAAMASVELPPQLAAPGWRVLADLQPNRSRLGEWHESCSRSHEQFAQKVSELEGAFQALRCEVEGLFLQAPSVDLDALGQALQESEALIDEQGSIVQVLAKDLATVRQLVEDVVAQLGASAGGASLAGAAVHDAARRRAAMTRDVLRQLQGIAAQQSRIRDMKHRLAVFGEVLGRQAAALGELQAAARLPAAYRLALAECARRAAWQEMFAAQAARLAEHCGRITAKEAGKREAVRRQLERHLPSELLARAGLLAEPPHCSVSVPPCDALLLPVTPAELARLPAVIQQAADAAAAAERQQQQQQQQQQAGGGAGPAPVAASAGAGAEAGRLARTRSGSGDGGAAASGSPTPPRRAAGGGADGAPPLTAAAGAGAASVAASGWLSRPGEAAAAAGGLGGGADLASNLALENARLRAELAAMLAHAAASELGEGGGGAPLGGGPSQLAASHLAAGAGAVASISLAASAAGAAVPGVPASVAAPLPSVAAALAGLERASAEGEAAAAARRALALEPVQAALAAKDELAAALTARCDALAADVASYESRIAALEAQLAARCGAGGAGGAPAPAAGDDAARQEPGPAAGAPAAGGGASPARTGADGPLAQSVAPVFVLDATRAASFFAAPAPPALSAGSPTKAGGGDAQEPAAATGGDAPALQAPPAGPSAGGGLAEQGQQMQAQEQLGGGGDGSGERTPPSVADAAPAEPAAAAKPAPPAEATAAPLSASAPDLRSASDDGGAAGSGGAPPPASAARHSCDGGGSTGGGGRRQRRRRHLRAADQQRAAPVPPQRQRTATNSGSSGARTSAAAAMASRLLLALARRAQPSAQQLLPALAAAQAAPAGAWAAAAGAVRLLQQPARGFAAAAAPGGPSLAAVLAKEIKHEATVYEQDPMVKAGPPAPFVLSATPGDTAVSLTRDFGGETVSVDCSVNMQEGLALPLGDDDDDDFGEGEGDEAALDGGDADAADVAFNVTVTRGDAALVFECISDGTYVDIRHVSLEPAGGLESETAFTGPVFGELDDELQAAFRQYLQERGVTEDLGEYLRHLMYDKEQQEYVAWLRGVAAFVA
ncbi:ATG11 [Scenedesmus sp. PABB004]|nr:ATG11 [Scenedesmus sp. PABB004]